MRDKRRSCGFYCLIFMLLATPVCAENEEYGEEGGDNNQAPTATVESIWRDAENAIKQEARKSTSDQEPADSPSPSTSNSSTLRRSQILCRPATRRRVSVVARDCTPSAGDIIFAAQSALPTIDYYTLAQPAEENRWDITQRLGAKLNYFDPYRPNNPLKADRPLRDDWFLFLNANNAARYEFRNVDNAMQGQQQQMLADVLSVDATLYRGDTVFKPADLDIRLAASFNYSRNPNALTDGSVSNFGFTQFYTGFLIGDTSVNYDFQGIRIGLQPYSSDPRGTVFSGSALGVKWFGRGANNTVQWNAGLFAQVQQLTGNPGYDLFDGPREDIFLAGHIYWQDFLQPGLTLGVTGIVNSNAEPASAAFGDNNLSTGDYDVAYLGAHLNGPIYRFNISTSLYLVQGEQQGASEDSQSVSGLLSTMELSYDYDNLRTRFTWLYASGDGDPFDSEQQGFDNISAGILLAGGAGSHWRHTSVGLGADNTVVLSQSDRWLNSLRAGNSNAPSNFMNPGLQLFGVGMDWQLSPRLKLATDINYLEFVTPELFDALFSPALTTDTVAAGIGTELTLQAYYRPDANQQTVINVALSFLSAGSGYSQLVGDSDPLSLQVNINFAY